jgi:hypothetical protein
MSIVRSDEISTGNGGKIEYRDKKFMRTSTRVFRVQCDQDHDEQYILNNAYLATPDPVPVLFAVHPTSNAIRVRSIDPRPETSVGERRTSYIVTVSYDNEVPDDEGDQEEDPLQRRIRYRLDWETYEKVLPRDLEGRPIENTVKDAFDPPLTEEEERPVLVVTRNEDAANLNSIVATAVLYRGAVNSDTVLGWPKGHVRLRRITMSDLKTENVQDTTQEYYEVTYEFAFKEEDLPPAGKFEQIDGSDPEPWDRLVLNQGFSYYATANASESKVSIKGSSPRKIKSNGTLFAATDTDPYYYRAFRTKRRMPFNALGLF